MIPIITFLCASAFGLWAGGMINKFIRRFSPTGLDDKTRSLPIRILTAIVFGCLVIFVTFSPEWMIAIPFAAALVIVTVTDLRYMIIPDLVILPCIFLVAFLRIFVHPLPYMNYVAASIIGSGAFYLVALLIRTITKRDAIGGGDIKLLALTGLVLGSGLSVLSFLLFCFAGMLAGMLIILTGRARKGMVVPFGPFIGAASIISYFWGTELFSWALSQII